MNSNKNSLRSTVEAVGLLLAWVVVAATAPSCSTSPQTIADPSVFPVADLVRLNQFDYEIADGGIEIELSECTLHQDGRITASLDFLNPAKDETVPVVVVFALEGLGVEHLVWALPPGEAAGGFNTQHFSSAAAIPLAEAISMSVPGSTKCFVAIVGFEDDKQRRVTWPNSVSPLELAAA